MSCLSLKETRAALEEDVAAALGSRYAWALHTEPVKRAIDVAADLVFVGEVIRTGDEFWQKWVYPEGMTAEEVRNELADFHFMMEQVSLIYMHITGGRLNKRSYCAGTIISECDAHLQDQIDDAVREKSVDLAEQTLELCWAIEALPASEQQTKVSRMASDLLKTIRGAA